MNYGFYKDGVTQSLVSTFVQCRQKAKFYIEGYTSPQTKPSLLFGDAAHYVLEQIYQDTSHKFSLKKCMPIISKALKKWAKLKYKEKASVDSVVIETICGKLEVLLPLYIKRWGKDDRRTTWEEAESVFDVDFEAKYTGYIRLRGMRDALYWKKGKLWLLETKTKSRIEDSIIDSLSFDFQLQFYLLSIVLSGYHVGGALYNIIRNPGQKQKKGEKFSDYLQRIGYEAEADPDHYFQRYEIAFTKREIENFSTELSNKLYDMEKWLEDQSIATYKNQMACTGKYRCGYMDACISGSTAGLIKRKHLFEELEGR